MEIEYYAFIKTAKKESSLDYSLQNLVIINQIFIQLEFSEIIYYYIFWALILNITSKPNILDSNIISSKTRF
jgi:hypothetical protein